MGRRPSPTKRTRNKSPRGGVGNSSSPEAERVSRGHTTGLLRVPPYGLEEMSGRWRWVDEGEGERPMIQLLLSDLHSRRQRQRDSYPREPPP